MLKAFCFVMFTFGCLFGGWFSWDIKDEEWRVGLVGSFLGLWLYVMILVAKFL